MERKFTVLDADEGLEKAFLRFGSTHLRAFPVESGGRLVGLLTRDHINEFMAIQNALSQSETGMKNRRFYQLDYSES